MKPVKPKALRRGDVIGVIAPASAPTSQEKIDKGAEYLERLGYRVKFGKNVRAVRGFLAGTDEERAADVNEMFADKQVRAIIAVRGGYGTPRLLPLINYHAHQTQSKNLRRLQRPHRITTGVIQKNRIGFILRADGRSGNVQRHRRILPKNIFGE